MAPILSKEPPLTSQAKIDNWVKKSRPLVDSIFDILKDFGTMGRMCAADAEGAFATMRVKLDRVCVGGVRLLESLCCLDLNRFAKPEKPLTGSLPILFVLMLLVMLYNAFVFGYMPAAGIAVNSATSLRFHAWIFLTLSSFIQAVRTDPGSTPMTSKWCDKDHPPSEARERKRGSDEARWCRKSDAYKPDRAHYCRVLKKGVLRMDHYCPWLGNTVGFFNQKYFFLFLMYANAACAELGINFIQFLVQYTLPAMTTFCMVGAEGLTVLISSLLVPFFLFHIWLIARNTTTIEFCESMQSKTEGDANEPLRYDMGIYQNFSQVLGPNPLLWLLPMGGPSGDGITFPTNPKCMATTMNRASTGSSASEIEQPLKAFSSGDDDGPESTHPMASAKANVQLDVQGNEDEDQDEVDAAEEDGESSEGVATASAPSEGGEQDFLVWKDSAEFAEDLTIGCQFIGEKVEDCTRGSVLLLMASCVPGAWGRKAARRLSGTTNVSSSSRGFSERSIAGLRSAPAVRIVPVREGGANSSGEGEGDSCSSASGYRLHGHGDFLSD